MHIFYLYIERDPVKILYYNFVQSLKCVGALSDICVTYILKCFVMFG